MSCLSPTGVCFSSFSRAAEAPASPDASCRRASPFLRDQKRRQKSRRECDSPFQTPVGTENRTFPGWQPLPTKRTGKGNFKPYSYFSFGSGVRERSQFSAHKATNCGPPEGEASGPPANAETCFLSVGLIICLVRQTHAFFRPLMSRGIFFLVRPRKKTKKSSENRTFQGQQPLPVFRHQCKKPGVLFRPQIILCFCPFVALCPPAGGSDPEKSLYLSVCCTCPFPYGRPPGERLAGKTVGVPWLF